MFRGHVQGREFVVDDIYDAADTEQLDFEVAASIIPRASASFNRLENMIAFSHVFLSPA